MLKEIIIGLLIIGLLLLTIIIIFIPSICTLILGTYFATTLGLNGIVWWAFVIIFFIILIGVLRIITSQR